MRLQRELLSSTIRQIMLSAGVDDAQALAVAENLVWCDMVARRNHGVERLPILLKHVAAGTIKCPCNPKFHSLAPAIQKMDADQSFGHYAGRLAIDRACDLAAEQGVGLVGVLNSNFFGAGGYYADLAAKRNMISLVLSNSFPKVAAPGGLQAVLGTNPFTFGAPRREGRPILVDMSTAAIAGSTVREKLAQGEPLPEGVAIDADGNHVLDPKEIVRGTLLPAAGAKGFGLAVLVEIIGSVLTGAAISHEVGSMYGDMKTSGRNGHFILALDPTRFMPIEDFFDRMDFLTETITRTGQDGAVRMPGDSRWKNYHQSLRQGIMLEPKTLAGLEELAYNYAIAVPWIFKEQDNHVNGDQVKTKKK